MEKDKQIINLAWALASWHKLNWFQKLMFRIKMKSN